MNILKHYPYLLLTLVAITTIARGQTVLFSDDFQSYTPDAPLTGPEWSAITTATDATLNVVLDDGDPLSPANSFGMGTDNQILQIKDTTSSGNIRMDATGLSYQVATLSFYYYESSAVNGTKLRLTFGESSNTNANWAFQATFNGGVLSDFDNTFTASYSQDTLHRVDMVVNTSTSSVSYNEGSDSVASLTFDIWIDGELKGDNIAVVSGTTVYTTGGTDMTTFRFVTDFSGLSREAYIDNVFLFDGADINHSIPEPGHTALLFAGIIGMIAMHRFRSSRKRSLTS